MILIIVPIASQQTICQNSIHTYSVDESENGGLGTMGSNYVWYINDPTFAGNIVLINTTGNQISIDWGTSPVGIYTLNAKEVDSNGCANIVSMQITVEGPSDFEMNDVYKCPDQMTVNLVGPIDYDGYEWFDSSGNSIGNTSSIQVTSSGIYTLQVTLGSCSSSGTIEVIDVALPVIAFEVQNTNTLIVNTIGGTAPYRYQLLNSNQVVIRPWQDSPIFTNVERGTYLVMVQTVNGECLTSEEVQIFSIPNTFTPNDDGINDTWNISALVPFGMKGAQIYDRYGKLLYYMNSAIGWIWDGTYLGRKLPSTSYWYVIELENQDPIKGSVTIRNSDDYQ